MFRRFSPSLTYSVMSPSKPVTPPQTFMPFMYSSNSLSQTNSALTFSFFPAVKYFLINTRAYVCGHIHSAPGMLFIFSAVSRYEFSPHIHSEESNFPVLTL